MGNHHPLVRLTLLVTIPGCYLFVGKFREDIKNLSTHKVVVILLVLVSILRVGQFSRKMLKSEVKTEDIAVVYQKSINRLLDGENPYRQSLDPYPFHYKGNDHYFDRPKYTPLQIFTYAPFVSLLGLKGVYVGNLVVYLLLGLFLYRYFKPSGFHYLSLLMLVGAEFLFNKVFSKGVNDLLPAYLALLSWHSLTNEKKAGCYLGFSFLAKQLPAGLFGLWFLILKKWKGFLITVPIVLVVSLPFFLSDLKAVYENLLLFNLLRPVRETSLLLVIPPAFQKIVSLFGLISAITLPLYYKNKWGIPFIGLTLFIMTSKMSPGNYFIWTFPFLVMWLLDQKSLEKTV